MGCSGCSMNFEVIVQSGGKGRTCGSKSSWRTPPHEIQHFTVILVTSVLTGDRAEAVLTRSLQYSSNAPSYSVSEPKPKLALECML